eukprot:scaffold934_cov271-Prasinococcus_capsulatus_cf.AAC.2
MLDYKYQPPTPGARRGGALLAPGLACAVDRAPLSTPAAVTQASRATSRPAPSRRRRPPSRARGLSFRRPPLAISQGGTARGTASGVLAPQQQGGGRGGADGVTAPARVRQGGCLALHCVLGHVAARLAQAPGAAALQRVTWRRRPCPRAPPRPWPPPRRLRAGCL